MAFFDWLLGACQIGWAKTAFLSLALGIPLWIPLYSPSSPATSNRFVVIALGYPILALARWLYWRWREGNLTAMMVDGDPRALEEIDKIQKWRPQLWAKYAQAISAVLERVGADT